MPLTRLFVENYKCFRDRQDLELRPITVVLGKNNSGKSALVRAPLVIATGIHTDANIPLDLDRLGDNSPEFVDLVHGRLEHGSVTIGLGFDDPRSTRVTVTVQNIAEWQTQVVSRWSAQNARSGVVLEWLPEEDRNTSDDRRTRPYALSQDGAPERHVRVGRLNARTPVQDEFGARTAAILVTDHVRRGGRLIAKINEFMDEHLPGWMLEVQLRVEGVSIGLRSTQERGIWVPITDVGTGVTQILPILLSLAQRELAPTDQTVLEIIEEPELHLHPLAQAELADLFIATVVHGGTRFLIETHSETFLLRLRRRVAEGRLDPDMIVLYFVERVGSGARARRIDIDEMGNVDYWPQGIFSEDLEEVRALAAAQSDRVGPDAR